MKDQDFSVNFSTEEENTWLDSKIEEFYVKKLSFSGKQLEIPMNYVIKKGNIVIAGLKSCFYLEEVLSICIIFVDENYRNIGLGSILLDKVEKEARTKGAKLAHLYAFDEAKDFYIKHGYEIFGVLDNCPKTNHCCYYLKKSL